MSGRKSVLGLHGILGFGSIGWRKDMEFDI